MRYADQLVGVLVIIAIVALIVVIFLLGRTQRWFSKNYEFKTYAATASGLSRNMDVVFKGVSIGKVKNFDLLDDDRIEVIFSIQDQYRNRVKEGSLVEVIESAIGLGNKFFFYSGLGAELEEGDFIPMLNSPEGRAMIALGITDVPPKDDFIADLAEKAGAIFDELQLTLKGLNVATDERAATALGQVIANVQELTANLTEDMANPDGIRKILNGSGDSINSLEATFVSLAGTLDHVEKAASRLPREMPQIFSLITEARGAVISAQDVLTALKNNPLLRGGIPEHAEIDASGTNPRNISF